MRIHQEITERIRYVERFEVLVSGKKLNSAKSTNLRSDEYPFSRAANRQMPISKWLETRFSQTYPGFQASVIYPNGLTVSPDIPIGVVRDAYKEVSSVYGQSMRFKFYSNDESSIIKLKTNLRKAGIETKFASPSILWLWQWYTVESEILRIHLPMFHRLALPNILKLLTSSKDIGFEFNFSYDSCHLFEAKSDYLYFGMEQFKLLKSLTS
ncbi:hypothetical protein H6G76_04620 [Nostoc sp. FACHB-152]|uniref:hypothetical protein n=1 Tax=unclassified Nostoc TaxID=2593658 RepID=UPI001685BCBF|nr:MULTISPECIES: hypothetical protein [unclassified Nostoc]MBD2446453.1 hypothetical protein [Nostoc sp. FACHB-152]MBD2469592.1 hypothetical protein [Nostoc sp. FACHB-145]